MSIQVCDSSDTKVWNKNYTTTGISSKSFTNNFNKKVLHYFKIRLFDFPPFSESKFSKILWEVHPMMDRFRLLDNFIVRFFIMWNIKFLWSNKC